MEIVTKSKIDLNSLGHSADCLVHCIHLKIKDIKSRSTVMIEAIGDTSWIASLDAIDQLSYRACASKTIKKLTDSILKKVEETGVITEEFGEYLISHISQDLLSSAFDHKCVPLAELFKDKISNNMGFDFHTESTASLIVFGEAKYSAKINPYSKAINQIIQFIEAEKDIAELMHVRKFVSEAAAKNATEKRKGFVASFSLNARDPAQIMANVLKSEGMSELIKYGELYLVGVEIDA